MSSTPEKIDKYVVLGELGRGAMGTVYKARDPVLDRLVAIKMMSEELMVEEEMRRRFNSGYRGQAVFRLETSGDQVLLPPGKWVSKVLEFSISDSKARWMVKGEWHYGVVMVSTDVCDLMLANQRTDHNSTRSSITKGKRGRRGRCSCNRP